MSGDYKLDEPFDPDDSNHLCESLLRALEEVEPEDADAAERKEQVQLAIVHCMDDLEHQEPKWWFRTQWAFLGAAAAYLIWQIWRMANA